MLPPKLRALAIQRLQEVSYRVKDFKYVKENPILLDITLGQIKGVINFLNASDEHDRWLNCVEFNHRLDKTRNQCFENVTPEFKPYV